MQNDTKAKEKCNKNVKNMKKYVENCDISENFAEFHKYG